MRRLAIVLLGAITAGCAVAPRPESPAVLIACPVDTAALRRCAAPILLPDAPADAIVTLAAALDLCRAAAADAVAALDRAAE